MKWQNLKENKCPKCSRDISQGFNMLTKMVECVCGFKISQEKFQKIVSSIVTKELSKKLDEEYKND